MATNPATSAVTSSTNEKQKLPESRSPNMKQESSQNKSNTDKDASSWNVVAVKRNHDSSPSVPTLTHARGNRSKLQSHKVKAGGPLNYKQRHPKQQHLPRQHSKTNTNNKSNNNAKSNLNTNNNRKAHQKNMPSENANKKVKPKPKDITVGDMLPLSKKKKFNDDSNKKVSHQQKQQPKPKQEYKAQQARQNSHQRQPPQRQQLHTESVHDFPALGASSGPSTPQLSGSSVPKAGWGAVPKPPPGPSITTFKSEVKGSTSSTRAHKNNNRQVTSLFPELTASRSSLPSKRIKPDPCEQSFVGKAQQRPTQVLKRGGVLQAKGSAAAKGLAPTASNKKKKAKPTNTNIKSKLTQQEDPPSAASFFQPRLRALPDESKLHGGTPGRELEGEEHQLLRLVQERNVYQKRGRQRVAPRKKKFTALKKKVLQERLDQWRALHPEELPEKVESRRHGTNPSNGSTTQGSNQGLLRTRSLCLYNYTELDELQDEDEYEEILENLTSMATKIGPIDGMFLPRSSVQEKTDNPLRDNVGATAKDSNNESGHPVFILFHKESDASAALACWSDLLIGGSKLEVFGLEVHDETIEAPLAWSERALAAELKRRNQLEKATVFGESRTTEILLQKVLTEEDYEDEDCMSESLDDLKKIGMRFGAVGIIRAAGKNGDVLVTYDNANLEEAREIAQNLCRVVVGGQPLYASVCEPPVDRSGGSASPSTTTLSTLLLENVLTEDDLQDIDCLQESLNDIKELCLRYGTVSDIFAKGSAVKVTYENTTMAQKAACELNGIVLGGNNVKASVLTTIYGDDNPLDHSIDLYNLITEDDLEDEDCMEESLGDVQKLASNYGEVVGVNICKGEDNSSNDPTKVYVRIQFGGNDPVVVAKAFEGFSGMVIGGQIVSASISASGSAPPQDTETTNPGDKRKQTETLHSTVASKASDNTKKARTDDKEPLYSGDKLISERFAEMKRVPKIPNKEGPRSYASGASTDERIKPLLAEMLGELMRLQKRAVEDKNAKARRRMVMGLREVARGIRAHKVKMVVMANNLDQYGVIDDKLQEIIDLAKSEAVPLFFEFTKRSLGKAIGKSIKIAVVGIQNADGAHQPFKKLNTIAGRV